MGCRRAAAGDARRSRRRACRPRCGAAASTRLCSTAISCGQARSAGSPASRRTGSKACCWSAPKGAPLLATALSKRVSDWIRTTSHLGEIINTPKPGTAIGQRLAAIGGQAHRCPGIGCAAGRSLRRHHRRLRRRASSSMRRRCSRPNAVTLDAAERGLIERADAIAVAALGQVDAAQVAGCRLARGAD